MLLLLLLLELCCPPADRAPKERRQRLSGGPTSPATPLESLQGVPRAAKGIEGRARSHSPAQRNREGFFLGAAGLFEKFDAGAL